MTKMPKPREMLDQPSGLSSLSRYGNTSVVPPSQRTDTFTHAPRSPIQVTESWEPAPRKQVQAPAPARPAPQGTLAEVQPRPERVVTAAEVPVIIPPEIPGLPPEAQRVVREAVNTAQKAEEIERASALADALRRMLGLTGLDISVTDSLDDRQVNSTQPSPRTLNAGGM